MTPNPTPAERLVQWRKDAEWSEHFHDWCIDNCGGAEPVGRAHSAATDYADEMSEDDG